MAIVQSIVCALAFICLFGSSLATLSSIDGEIKIALSDYVSTGVKNKAYREVVESIKLPHMFRSNYEVFLDPSLYCSVCDGLVDTVITDRRNGSDAETIATFVTNICVNLNVESLEVCSGVVAVNMNTVLFMVDNSPNLTSKHICSVVLQGYGCESDMPVEWAVEIPAATIEVPEPELSAEPPIRIVQISDIHYDPNYVEGTLAACSRPLCCQPELGIPENPSDAAGRWGDYRNCDTPWLAIEDALTQIQTHTDIDYVYFTGDIISHKVWATERLNNTMDISKVLQAYADAFSVPVFPILGNHEPHPVNVYVENPDPQVTTQWVYDLSAVEWSRWLPEDTRETILKGGYYTTLVKPGLRVIGLNSNVCYTYNFWLIQNEVDPFGQLAWLIEVLSQAEVAGERVHILSHIPSGGCLKNWSREFRRIIDRFSGTIAGIFNGHSHNDQFHVFYKKDNIAEAGTVAYNGGSITTFSDLNPNYKIYDVDAGSFEVLDIETWIYNLTEANLTPDQPPVWFKEYSFKETYGLTRMRPQDMDQLVQTMATSSSLLDFYFRYYYKEGDTSLALGCDANCQLSMLCGIVENEFGDSTKCQEISAIFKPQK